MESNIHNYFSFSVKSPEAKNHQVHLSTRRPKITHTDPFSIRLMYFRNKDFILKANNELMKYN